LASTGALLWSRLFGGGPPAPEETPPAAPVKWEAAGQRFVEQWTEALGTTQPLPDRAARITAPVEGRVVSVLQDAKSQTMVEGQLVKQGDLIVQLDASLAKANRDKLEASHDELKQLTKQAEFALELAKIDVTRLAELNKNTSIDDKLPLVSRIDIQKAQLALQDAESKLKVAAFREVTAKKELEVLDRQLQLYSLTAPIDGRLGRLLVVPGQTLSAGTLVSDVTDIDDQIDVLCFVPPHVAKKLQKGQPALIGGVEEPQPANPAKLQGKVEFIAEQAEMDTGNFAVKVRFPNKELGLRANTTVRIRVMTSPGMPRLTLPEAALFEDQDPPVVIVVENYKKVTVKEGDKDKDVETGTARKLRVKLGVRSRDFHVVEIISLEDPENKWKGTLVPGEAVYAPSVNESGPREQAMFVVQRGQGLRTGDAIRLEVEEE
jgi:RND family efflux transporter MFP subunit